MRFQVENSFCPKKWAIVLLLLFVASGSFIRLRELGKHGFWTDELLHVIAAKSLLETGAPIVPGKGEYTRAFPITAITALSIKLLGENEYTARLPFVVINILFVLVGYYFVQRLFNTNIALIFAFIMAFSPLEIIMSRECRMYSLFQFMYFTGSMFFLLGFENGNIESCKFGDNILGKLERSWNINVLYLGIAAIAFYISLKVQDLTLNFGVVALVYLSLMAIQTGVTAGIRKAISSKYSIFLAIICIGGLFSFLLFSDFFRYSFKMAISVPDWAIGENASYRYYQTYFTRHYPIFTYIYPLSILLMIIKYKEKGLFVFSSFFPLIIIHSFIYTGRISERYIFYIFPFFILGSSYLVERFIVVGHDFLKEYRNAISRIVYIILLICVLPAIYVLAKPWLGETRYVKDQYFGMDWKSVTAELHDIPENAIMISTRIKPVYYYSGRMPDYNVRKSLFEISEKVVNIGDKKLSINLIENSSELEKVMKQGKAVYFIAEKWSWDLPIYMDDQMRHLIETNFVPIPHGGNKDIMIFKMK